MKDYQFKVGDKGKTRHGRNYEVLAITDKIERGLIVVTEDGTHQNYLTERYLNGSVMKNGADPNDLLPPTRTVYVNFYKGGNAYYYDSEWRAKGLVDRTAIAIAVPVEIPG